MSVDVRFQRAQDTMKKILERVNHTSAALKVSRFHQVSVKLVPTTYPLAAYDYNCVLYGIGEHHQRHPRAGIEGGAGFT